MNFCTPQPSSRRACVGKYGTTLHSQSTHLRSESISAVYQVWSTFYIILEPDPRKIWRWVWEMGQKCTKRNVSGSLYFISGTSSRLWAQYGLSCAPTTSLTTKSHLLFSISLNYTSGLQFVFPINMHRHAIMNHPSLFPRTIFPRVWFRDYILNVHHHIA